MSTPQEASFDLEAFEGKPRSPPLLRIRGVSKVFGRAGWLGGREPICALRNVTLSVALGETLGIVGESGSGKTTLGRVVSCLTPPTSGSVYLDGAEITAMSGASLRRARRTFQSVQQDPGAALNPRMRALDIVEEPLRNLESISTSERRERAQQALERVGLGGSAFGERLPAQLSGGQKQRLCLARAIVVRPKLIVADEPTSALDVIVQAQILDLMAGLRAEFAMSCLLISHNVAVIAALSDHVAVMYRGAIVEMGPADTILNDPLHPYTRELMSSVLNPHEAPRPSVRGKSGRGEIAPRSDAGRSKGCSYRSSCPMAGTICELETPRLASANGGQREVACWDVRDRWGTAHEENRQERSPLGNTALHSNFGDAIV